MPVFPLVASRMTRSRVSAPLRSPSRIIERAARSLTEPPGLRCSALANNSTLRGSCDRRRGKLSNGVPPMFSSSPVKRPPTFSDAPARPSRRNPKLFQVSLRQVPVRDFVLRLEIVFHALRRVVNRLRRRDDDLIALLPVGGRCTGG